MNHAGGHNRSRKSVSGPSRHLAKRWQELAGEVSYSVMVHLHALAKATKLSGCRRPATASRRCMTKTQACIGVRSGFLSERPPHWPRRPKSNETGPAQPTLNFSLHRTENSRFSLAPMKL